MQRNNEENLINEKTGFLKLTPQTETGAWTNP
jgi:hypothetical protein